MEPLIRKITAADLPAVLNLMAEFAEYERLTEFCTVTEQRLSAAMFGPKAFVDGLLGVVARTPAAYALFYPAFSSFRGERGLHLEDIYVQPGHRGLGLGSRMLKELAREAHLRGFERIDLQVLEWNHPAIDLYLKHGAAADDGERHFKFRGEAFRRLAG